jgi:hypothetical protein
MRSRRDRGGLFRFFDNPQRGHIGVVEFAQNRFDEWMQVAGDHRQPTQPSEGLLGTQRRRLIRR